MKQPIIVILLTLLASALVFKLHNAESIRNEKLFSFPLTIGQWLGKDIPMEGWVFDSLDTPYAILRDYSSPNGDVVNLAVTWYDDKEIAFHAPEACLGGLGNKVKDKAVYQLNKPSCQDFPVGKLLVERNNMTFLVLYYFINDGYVTASQVELRKKVMLKRLYQKRTSCAFVRLMMPIHKSQEHTRMVLEDFLTATLPTLIEYTDTKRIL